MTAGRRLIAVRHLALEGAVGRPVGQTKGPPPVVPVGEPLSPGWSGARSHTVIRPATITKFVRAV